MRRTIGVIAFVEAVDVLGYALLLPRSAAVAARFGLNVAGAWALFATPVVAAALGALYLVPLSERHGRKPVLVGTCLVTAEALFVTAWAGDIYMLMMARIMAGLAAGNLAVAEASLRDVMPSRDTPLRTTGVACVAGLLGAWVLASVLPVAAAAYLAGALAVLSLVGVVSLLPETHPVSAGVSATRARGGPA